MRRDLGHVARVLFFLAVACIWQTLPAETMGGVNMDHARFSAAPVSSGAPNQAMSDLEAAYKLLIFATIATAGSRTRTCRWPLRS